MPQTASAAKALRVNERQRAVNDHWRKKMRESVRRVRDTIAAGKKTEALTAFHEAQSMIDRATRHHILKPNTSARRKSRLMAAISKLSA